MSAVATTRAAEVDRQVRFGAGFLGHGSRELGLEHARAAVRICDEAGLDSFWHADRRWMRDVYVTLADLAARSDAIHLGTRVTDPYVRHPAVTAVAIATLDEASGGRAILGLGAGGTGFSQIGLQRIRPATALREAIQIIRRLWAGEAFTFDGEVVSWGGGGLDFKCRSDIPIVLVGRSPLMLQVAGELADGSIVASGLSARAIEWARGHIEHGEAKLGRARGATELLHMTYVTVTDDRRAGLDAAKRAVAAAVAGSYPTFDFLSINDLEVPPELSSYLATGSRDLAEVARLIPDSFVDRLAVVGSADECADQLVRLLDTGVRHPLITPVPAVPGGDLELLRFIAKEVLPGLRDAAERNARPSSATL